MHVGARLRKRRQALSISQERLGAQLGLTFQQVQKYEKGVNRIGASRLYQIAQALDAPVQYFFEGAPTSEGEEEGAGAATMRFLGTVEGLQLNTAFQKLKHEQTRRKLLELVQTISDLETDELKA